MKHRKRKKHLSITLKDKNDLDRFPDSISGYKPPNSKNKKDALFYERLMIRRYFIQKNWTFEKLCQELGCNIREFSEPLQKHGYKITIDSKLLLEHSDIIGRLILVKAKEIEKYEKEITTKYPKLVKNYFKLIYSGR